MSFNWIAGVEGDIDEIEDDDIGRDINRSVNEDESSQDNSKDQDINYNPILCNVPHSQNNTYPDVLNNLHEINQDELDNLHEIYEDE